MRSELPELLKHIHQQQRILAYEMKVRPKTIELRALRGENDRLKGELFEGGMLQELEELKWQAAQGQAKADAFVAYLRLCPPAPDNFSALALAGVALG